METPIEKMYKKAITRPKMFKKLCNISIEKFFSILPEFKASLKKIALKKDRKRAPGGGRKGALKTDELKLFYVLFYYKYYPKNALASILCDCAESKPSEWDHLFEALEMTLGEKLVLPKRKFEDEKEFFNMLNKIKCLKIDGTNREIRKPTSPVAASKNNSGHKKNYSVKNLVMSDNKDRIVFLSDTDGGSVHDLEVARNWDVIKNLPTDIILIGDAGFTSLEKNTDAFCQIIIKKPIKKELSKEQKFINQDISKKRVKIEHLFAKLKTFDILSSVYRGSIDEMDRIINICCGLYNLKHNFIVK